jgi:hypothetical protein
MASTGCLIGWRPTPSSPGSRPKSGGKRRSSCLRSWTCANLDQNGVMCCTGCSSERAKAHTTPTPTPSVCLVIERSWVRLPPWAPHHRRSKLAGPSVQAAGGAGWAAAAALAEAVRRNRGAATSPLPSGYEAATRRPGRGEGQARWLSSPQFRFGVPFRQCLGPVTLDPPDLGSLADDVTECRDVCRLLVDRRRDSGSKPCSSDPKRSCCGWG